MTSCSNPLNGSTSIADPTSASPLITSGVRLRLVWYLCPRPTTCPLRRTCPFVGVASRSVSISASGVRACCSCDVCDDEEECRELRKPAVVPAAADDDMDEVDGKW